MKIISINLGNYYRYYELRKNILHIIQQRYICNVVIVIEITFKHECIISLDNRRLLLYKVFPS